MSRASRSPRSTQSSKKRLKLPGLLLRLGLLAGIVVLLIAAGFLLLQNVSRSGASVAVDLPVSPALNPIEAARLGTYLAVNGDVLNTPLSSDTEARTFEIVSGQSATQIGDNLVAQGFISDARAFTNYLRYYGLDTQLEAGFYAISPSMTIPEIALTLTDASVLQVTAAIPEGWRREQIADWIDAQPEIPFTGVEFLVATNDASLVPETLAASVPEGVPLEGYLFPDTYNLTLGATAEDLVRLMLETFDARVTEQMRQDAAAQGFTMYEVVTLASIVEREARVPDERPLIASVYLNRLSVGMMLQADPTVQYAQGFQPETGEWWNRGLTQADYTNVQSPYNTYLNAGLPPGPIANPGLSSIQAVIYAESSPYFFFRATCDDSGRHNFAVTFEEHVANACQ